MENNDNSINFITKKIINCFEKEILLLSKKLNNYLKIYNSGILDSKSLEIVNIMIHKHLSVINIFKKRIEYIVDDPKSFIMLLTNSYLVNRKQRIQMHRLISSLEGLNRISTQKNKRIEVKLSKLIVLNNDKLFIPKVRNVWSNMNKRNRLLNQTNKLFDFKDYLLEYQKALLDSINYGWNEQSNNSQIYIDLGITRNQIRITKINNRINQLKRKSGKIVEKVNILIKNQEKRLTKI